MKTKTIEVYLCDHCNKLYQRKHFVIAHEKICTKNPDYFRPCHDCVNLNKVDTWTYVDSEYSNAKTKLSVLYCKKLDVFIYPPSVEAKGNYFDALEKLNKPMPEECKELIKHEIF